MSSPLGLTTKTAGRTDTPTDMRQGTVVKVTGLGIDVAVGSGLIPAAAHLKSYNPVVGDTVIMLAYGNSWLVLGSAVGPGTDATDAARPGSAVGKVLLDGQALTKSGAILATSTGAAVTVPRYSLTFFHPKNHWVEVVASYTYFSTVAGDVLQVQLYETISATAVDTVEYNVLSGSSWFVTASFAVPPSFGGTKRNYVLRVLRLTGTGNCRLEDHSVRRGHFEGYDLGDQAFYRTV